MDLEFTGPPATEAERAAITAAVPAPSTVDIPGRVVRSPGAVLRHHLLPALAAVQSAIGWISPGALDEICRRLEVPPADAYGVATFYSLLSVTERPARVAHVCDDIACRGAGALALLEELGDHPHVISSPCLGQCDRRPAVLVQRAGQDDLVLTGATIGEIEAALAGSEPAEQPAPVVIGDRLLARVGRVNPESLDDYRRQGGYLGLAKAVEIGPEAVVAEVKTSGLKGRGGAAYPTGLKWEAVAGGAETVRYLVCNADESEPGTFKDRVVMEGDPFSLVEAMTIAGFAVGARQGYLYLRGEYPLAARRLASAIESARHAGLLGSDVMGAGFGFDIELRRGQGAYICGEETALFNSIEGFRGEPRQKPPFPVTEGLFRKPTVINNVETLVNVLPIVIEGGETFAGIGTSDSTGTRLFCLSGDIGRPGVYEIESGSTLGELIEMAGGAPAGIQTILLGGAAGSFVGPDQLGLRLTFEDTRAAGVSLGSGVVMVFAPDRDIGDAVQRIARFFRDESCGQCVPCRVGTARVEEAIAGANGSRLDPGAVDLIAEIDRAMKDASICGLGHTAATAVRSAIGMGLL